jgi:hypothetical protein
VEESTLCPPHSSPLHNLLAMASALLSSYRLLPLGLVAAGAVGASGLFSGGSVLVRPIGCAFVHERMFSYPGESSAPFRCHAESRALSGPAWSTVAWRSDLITCASLCITCASFWCMQGFAAQADAAAASALNPNEFKAFKLTAKEKLTHNTNLCESLLEWCGCSTPVSV